MLERPVEPMTLKAKVYISFTLVLGLLSLIVGLTHWECREPVRYVSYLLIAVLASGLKIRLPGVNGTMSVNFLFLLIAIVELGLAEALTTACAAALMQCVWRTKTRIHSIKVLFSVASMATATTATYFVYHSFLDTWLGARIVLLLALTAGVFFVTNTFPVAVVIAMTERKRIITVWRECYFWCLPYYMIGAAIAGLVDALSRFAGWQTSLLAFPVIYWIYRSYRLYLERLEAEKKHAVEMAGLHLRTIEALALAIEAKDSTTHSHLRRVAVYAFEIGKELGLSEAELEALRAAALLHDIGKLAVPEHIISKPGKLTPVEFEKIKIHPIVGAEILNQVEFPYPVVPIVRAHHEKWDGSGYPDGLQGEQIPIGARILSAVDCLDALATDRHYRRAIPLDEAMVKVASDAGKSFDPRVVEILRRRYLELEELAQNSPGRKPKLSTGVRIGKGLAPAAGFESQADSADTTDFLSPIAAARQEAQQIFELTQNLGNSLSLNETLSVAGKRLKRMIPYHAMAIYICQEDMLVPEYVVGDDFQLLASLRIPLGAGLSGWVAETRKPIVNGNPCVEWGYLDSPQKVSNLWSALSVPLEGSDGIVGVLTLYHRTKDFFVGDHLRILLAVTPKVSLSVENALKYRQVENCATTDALTGLPNARSLFAHLDSELARCKRLQISLAVLVCDLDGFKSVNDHFGHLEGNRVLRAVAKGLRDACREYDYVARMGGDEFVVVMPGDTPEAVEATAKRLARVAEEAGHSVLGERMLSLSVGGAFCPSDGCDAEQLLAEADRRMYNAKHKLNRSSVTVEALGWQSTSIH